MFEIALKVSNGNEWIKATKAFAKSGFNRRWFPDTKRMVIMCADKNNKDIALDILRRNGLEHTVI